MVLASRWPEEAQSLNSADTAGNPTAQRMGRPLAAMGTNHDRTNPARTSSAVVSAVTEAEAS